MKEILTIELLPAQDKSLSIKYDPVASHKVFCTEINNAQISQQNQFHYKLI